MGSMLLGLVKTMHNLLRLRAALPGTKGPAEKQTNHKRIHVFKSCVVVVVVVYFVFVFVCVFGETFKPSS